jgi:hypothetical protein
LITGVGEPNGLLTIFDTSTGQPLVTRQPLPANGQISIVSSSCYAGDVLLVSVSDGAQEGPKTAVKVSGSDTTAPVAPTDVRLSASVGGRVTVTATVEPNATLVVTNMFDSSVYTATADGLGNASVAVSAFRGDTLRVQCRDAAGLLGAMVTTSVPTS